jgi:eukaryotic-like serine/threonine-protein kinase
VSDRFGAGDDTVAATLDGTGVLQTRADARSDDDEVGGLAAGAVIGRYVVLSRLGAGGMGVVYAGYDPELDRKVALKLLLQGRRGSEGRSRLLREAQALAKLQHPNVVTIHDVGMHDARVWIAMEIVEGDTFGRWCGAKPRRWPEVLDVLVRAGRGVAAAHAAGLLHRDLKPDNVMVGTDGRVRVMDFGLARTQAESSTPDDIEALLQRAADAGSPSSKVEGLELLLTRSGALMGTPAYMAPEQFRNAELGSATDQFGFCAMAWEALYGVRPFAAHGVVDLAVAVLQAKRAAVPRGRAVPRWLRRVLDRGLSVDPQSRWPSMEALLEALERGQARARWRRAGVAAAAVGAMAAGVLGWQWLDAQRRIASCEADGSSIAEVWNDEVRETLRAALVGTGVSHAETTAEKTMPWLDAYAQGWRTARTLACLEEVQGRWDAQLHARAQWCLDDRRMELEALVEELSRGEARAVDEAVAGAVGLAPLEPCQRPDALERTPMPPADAREAVRAVWAERSRAIALQSTGAYEEGLEVARAALERAQVLEWPPLVAETRFVVGMLLDAMGAYAEAEEALETAYFDAAQAGATELVAWVAIDLVFIVGYHLARHADGLRWSRHAEVALASLPDPEQIRLAGHLNNLALAHDRAGGYEDAKGLHARALAIREKALGPEHPDVAVSLNNLALVHAAAGGYEDAKKLHERALAIRETALGPEHPNVAMSLNNLALVHAAMGEHDTAKTLHERALVIQENALGSEHPEVALSLSNLAAAHWATGAHEEAKRLHERALSIREKALGPEHPDVASSLNNLAIAYRIMGSVDKAKGMHERALSIREEALGPEHPEVATSLNNLAVLHGSTGAYEEAKGLHERALAIQEKALGPRHPDIAVSLIHLASLHVKSGAYEEAKGLYARALAIWEEALGTEHPDLGYPLHGLANIALKQGHLADAVSVAERAVGVLATAEVPPTRLAPVRFMLARALWDAQRDRSRAVALAEQARDAWRNAGSGAQEDLAEVEAWLQARGGEGERR